MKQLVMFGFICVCLSPLLVSVANAQPAEDTSGKPAAAAKEDTSAKVPFGKLGSFGAGLVVIGAAAGIGRLAGSALESMARQPEVAGSIQTAMIIAAALIEGFTFYALFICSSGV